LRAAFACALACALTWGCQAPAAPTWRPAPAPASASVLEEVAALERAGRLEDARESLAAAVAAAPGDYDAAARLQDLESQLLVAGEPVPGFDGPPADPVATLRRVYRARAVASGRPLDDVLAARAEDDRLAALHLLDQALAKDGEFALAHYARAHVLFAVGRLGDARAALDSALERAPGLAAARRLEARLLAAEGDEQMALAALDGWLARTRGDPRVVDAERVDGELDAAGLELARGEARAALERLGRLPDGIGPRGARLELLRAAAWELRGDWDAALAAARRAADLAPADPLPLVYGALIHGRRRGDRVAARRAWLRVVELAAAGAAGAGAFDPRLALYVLRARVELAQLERGRLSGAVSRP